MLYVVFVFLLIGIFFAGINKIYHQYLKILKIDYYV